jgi:hypothetical protein
MPSYGFGLRWSRYIQLTLFANVAMGFLLTGCSSSYATPGRGADLKAFGVRADANTDGSIVQALGKRPLAQLPTGIAVVRVQSPGYRSDTAEGWGDGRYSIVTTRDVEKPGQIERLAKLPMVSGIAPINRLLLPRELKSDLELRQAGASLHADMLLVYTLDTTFQVEDKAAPLTLVTLGLSPNQNTRVVCTASAVLMDTRNGYIYGVAEATDEGGQLASAWTSAAALDDTRRRTESSAFEKLVAELEKSWMAVIQQASPVGRPVSSLDSDVPPGLRIGGW